MSIKNHLYQRLQIPDAVFFIQELADRFGIRTVLDVGCGPQSRLRVLRPKLFTVGVDAFAPALDEARKNRTHDAFVEADIAGGDFDVRVRDAGYESFDLVVLLDVIEHFSRRSGFRLLENCESLAAKYILVKTPNGFVPQGPEYGNPWQRHLSGWFPHDLESLGYHVYGADGMKCMMGYSGSIRYRYPGASLINSAMARWLPVTSHPRHAFSLIGIKSMAGHAAILGGTAEAA